MSSILENKSTIPFGAELKVLLNSDLISYGQIQNSLKSKGVFIGNSTKDKDIIAPLLSSMLLKPTEFSELIDQSIVRESKPKTRTALPLEIAAKDADWISALKSIDFLEGIEVKKGMDSITWQSKT